MSISYIIILLITFVVSRQSMENMFIELQREPTGEFQNFCTMSSVDFEYLLQKIGTIISKDDTLSFARQPNPSIRCPLFSSRRTVLRGWLTELTGRNRRKRRIETQKIDTGRQIKSEVIPDGEDKSLVYVL
jgi:hypothetical protein